jgi:hypothetical protein
VLPPDETIEQRWNSGLIVTATPRPGNLCHFFLHKIAVVYISASPPLWENHGKPAFDPPTHHIYLRYLHLCGLNSNLSWPNQSFVRNLVLRSPAEHEAHKIASLTIDKLQSQLQQLRLLLGLCNFTPPVILRTRSFAESAQMTCRRTVRRYSQSSYSYRSHSHTMLDCESQSLNLLGVLLATLHLGRFIL